MLVRHGQTPWNAAGRWQGHADPPLSALGREQARALAEVLVCQPETRWTGVVASDLQRARETAEILAGSLSLSVEVDSRLRELDVGAWTGLTRGEIESRDPERLAAFESGEPSVRPGGGESRLEIRRRARRWVRERSERSPGERLIVVTHLGVIRALLPGVEPGHTDRFHVVAEEISRRPLDGVQRPERKPL
jgi:broad specificity phosphatase PhoE